MALRYMNSMVFVGGVFPVELFNEHELFGGELDQGGQVKLAQVANFSYLSGSYRFAITPNRIDISYDGPHVIPSRLIEATRIVAQTLDNVRTVVQVSGFGMNCDTVLSEQEVGKDGASFCSRLVNRKFLELVGATSHNNPLAMGKVIFSDAITAMRYEVRIEPDLNSKGRDLFVAVNGHQIVEKEEPSDLKLKHVNAFKTFAQKIHCRIMAERSA